MSDKTIRVGDLCMIVKLMPCGHGILGYVFKVVSIRRYLNNCRMCGRIHGEFELAYEANGNAIATYRAIRIDPPAKDTETDAGESVTHMRDILREATV